MTKTAPTPKTNLAAKSALARLMAAEDIYVEVDASAPTAYFNVEERRLVLPLWDVEGDAYDMLVGHEVSHALYTPEGAAALEAACKSIDPKNYGVAKDYLNVVEDARIERLIKLDYPGLKRSFAAGYREFHARDIFGIKGKKVEDLALIDRINLHYKIGWLIDVPFTDAELPLVQRVAETRTWDEVVALSKEIYEFAKDQKKGDENEPSNGGKGKSREDDADADASAPSGDDDSESQDGESDADGMGGESDDGEESDGESLTDGKSDAEGEESEGKSGKSKGDGTAEGTEDDTDDGESAESEKTESRKSGNGDASSGSGEGEYTPDGSVTNKSMQDALDKMTKKSKRPIVYADLPEMPKDLVVPFATVEATYNKVGTMIPSGVASRVLAVWKNKNQSDVLALATEFERRKAADAHRRTVTAETGALDPTRLFAYKISDDIFLRASTVQDGKNHGLVVLLDMSGSMGNQILDTVVQLVNLTAFARRVNIPFKVYGFVDYLPKFAQGTKGAWTVKGKPKAKWLDLTDEHNAFRLLTLLESGTTQARWQNAAGHLLTWATALQSGSYGTANDYAKALKVNNPYYDVSTKYQTEGLTLNGTPTNQALLTLLTLVPQFKRDNNLQVVNTIILTDGEAGDSPLTRQLPYGEVKDAQGYHLDPLVIVRDPLTRREYNTWTENGKYQHSMGCRDQQALLAAMLRDRTGAKVININLITGIRGATWFLNGAGLYEGKPEFAAAKKKFKDNGFIALPNLMGFDEVIALNTANATETAFDFGTVTANTDTKAGQRELQKAFVKSLESRKGNRPLMARIAELVSKNL